jgi:hypothetical protein
MNAVQQLSPPEESPRQAAPGAPEAGQWPWRVRFARFMAGGNLIGLVSGAVLSIAFELPAPSVIGIALGALAWNEWRGRKLLIAWDARAPRRLALNQLFTFIVIAAYCAQAAYVTWTGPSPVEAALRAQPELAEVLGGDGQAGSFAELNELGRRTALAVYGAVAVGSLVVQGLTAALYLSLGSTLAARR